MAKGSPPKPPHPGALIKLIRSLAKDGKIAWEYHAEHERMPERGIDFADVLEVFRLGDIEGDITPGKKQGEWKCTVVGKLQWTTREAGVVTVVAKKSRLIVVTTEWMDP